MKRSLFSPAVVLLVLFLGKSAGWAGDISLFQDSQKKDKALYNAVVAGKRDKAKELIQAGIGLEYRLGTKGETPLHAMANLGRIDLIKLALDAGADKNAQNHKGWTPLMEAVAGGSLGAVLYLLEAGADPNLKDEWGQTTLMLASGLLQDEMADALIKAGADVNAIDNSNSSALIYSLSYGEDLSLIADVLIDRHYEAGQLISTSTYGPDLDMLKDYAHHRAEIIRLLVEAGAKLDWISKKGETVFQLAKKKEGFYPFIFLKEEISRLPAQSLASLVLKEDHESLKAEISLAKAADEVLTAFLAAAGKGDSETVKLLFPLLTQKKNRKAALQDGSLLAAFEGHKSALAAILELGASFDWGYDELTPFHVAVFKGRLDIVQYLVESRKDLGELNKPLIEAAYRGFVEIVNFLIEAAKDKLEVRYVIKEHPVNLIRKAAFNALTALDFKINWASLRYVGGAESQTLGFVFVRRGDKGIHVIFNALDNQRTQLVIYSIWGYSKSISKDGGDKVLAEIDKYLQNEPIPDFSQGIYGAVLSTNEYGIFWVRSFPCSG